MGAVEWTFEDYFDQGNWAKRAIMKKRRKVMRGGERKMENGNGNEKEGGKGEKGRMNLRSRLALDLWRRGEWRGANDWETYIHTSCLLRHCP